MPDRIKEAFEATKDNGIFLDEEDFRNSLAKEPKAVFELFKSDKKYGDLFLDYDDFENSLGLKKKPSTSDASIFAPPISQGTGQSVKLPPTPTSSTAFPSASKPQKSTIPSASTGVKTKVENLSDFNKKYNTNYTPAQMQGKQPVEIQPEDESFASELFQSAQRGSSMLGSMLANTPSFIYNVAAYPQNKIAELTGLPIGTSSAQIAETLGLPENEIANYYEQVVKDGQAKIQQKYDKSVTEYLFGDNPDYKKGFKLLSNQVVESAPISLSMMMGNAAGIGAVGSTLGGGLVFGAGNMQDLEGANMSETEKVENALSKGLFEGIFEQFGVTKLGGVVSDIFKKQGAEAAANIAKEGFKDVYLPVLKKYVGIGAEESLGEAATQFSQNMVTILSGENPNLNPMEGVADAALVGLGSSVAYSTPTAAAETLALSKKRKEIRENQIKLQKIEEAVANPETTPETKVVLSNMANDINSSIADAYDESKNLYQNLSEEDRVELSQILTKKQELEIAAQDPNIDEEIKKEIGLQIENIDNKINEISDRSAVEPKTEEIKTDESGISQEAAPKGDTELEVTEPVIEEGKEQDKEETPAVKEEITPEQIEIGKEEIVSVKEGKTITKNPIRLFKGLFGKRNPDGTRKSAHPDVKGVFTAVDEKIAERYMGEDGMGIFDIPVGTTIEVIRLENKKVPISKFREQETDAVNASDAQIVKLITLDAKGAEEQYIIKDPALIEKMQNPEDVKQTKEKQEDAVQEQTAGQVPVQPEVEIGEEGEGGKPETEPKKVAEEKQEEDLGYHGGNLKSKSDFLTVGYRGDQPFTGYYFFSDRERAEARGNRTQLDNKEVSVVDFSKYNLLKPTTNQYWVIKSGLKKFEDAFLRDGIDAAFDSLERYGGMKYGAKFLYEQILQNKELIKKVALDWYENELGNINEKKKIERLETLILKALGYEGVDVRGLKESDGDASPDSSSEGSVIFDLKPDTILESPDMPKAVSEEEQGKVKFPENVLKIAKELNLSPQQVENTYKKYDGSKNIEDITLEDYNKARAEGNKIKVEKSKKAFEVLLKEGSVSPTAKKKAAEVKKEVGGKTIKDAEEIMNNIDSIRQQLLDAGVIKSINCKWGK